MREVHISRQDLRVARVVDVPATPLAAGAVRLRLDLFGLTSNNITYAAMGDSFGYWGFFPGPEGWGRPPVWGFATVVQSTVDGIDEGVRYFGYFPLGETLDVMPVRIGPRGFFDGAPHRGSKPLVYNQYADTRTDATYEHAYEMEQVLFRALYPSGWWAADYVHQRQPSTVVISSASSKTAIATAHQLGRLGRIHRVALTSPRNNAYVRGIGVYEQTFSYDQVNTLSVQAPATYIDFLGRDELTADVHRALGTRLAHSVLVGATDWRDKPGGVQVPIRTVDGPVPELLAVPTYAPQRLQADPELGPTMRRDLRAFYETSRGFVTARRMSGPEAILEGWARLAAGDVAPREGLVLSF